MNHFQKILAISLVTSSLMASCKREELTPIQVLTEKPAEMSIQKTTGNFTDGDGERATGQAAIYKKDDTYQLVFENLMVNNGPNLHVYLSQEINPKNFVDLGDLKSIKGNQVYNIPANVDGSTYKYALVYCQRYSHLFGYAPLK
jgi:lantibiotic modifying enzyme